MTANAKTCSNCDEHKPLSDFARDRSKKDGKTVRCKACITVYNRTKRTRRGRPKPCPGVPTFESAALQISHWFGLWEQDRWTKQDVMTEVLRLFRETKCLQPPDLRPF